MILFGPPAVGKAAIANELCKLTGYKLFHNHMTADPVLAVLGFENGSYREIADEFRLRIFSAALEAKVTGIAFTIGWDLRSQKDLEFLKKARDIFLLGGGSVRFVELLASAEIRKDRVATPFRLEHKPKFDDIDEARRFVKEASERWQMNTIDAIPFPDHHIKIDTEKSNEITSAREIMRQFSLEAAGPA